MSNVLNNPNEGEKRILIVEDSLVLSQALEFGLKKAGYEVSLAFDGNEALIEIAKNKPNLILLDILMPNKNGFEVLKESIKIRKEQNIKTIMLTNFSEDENAEKCYALGADDYMIKANFTIADLIKKIKLFI